MTQMVKNKFEVTPEMNALLRKAGDMNEQVAFPANAEITQALQTPLRKGVLDGNTVDYYEQVTLAENASSEWPLDFLSPGTEKNFVSYTIPNHGRIPERHVEGDYIMIPTYDIGGSIDMLLKYARDARWDVVNRAMEVLRSQFVQKINDDAWQTTLAAAAQAGQFTKRLVSLAKTIMRRNSGGNSASTNRGILTDIYLSPEAMEDIRNWGVDQIDEVTRREIYVSGDGGLSRIFSVNLHDLDELGEGQSYQLFYANQLSGTLPSGDVEIMVGLDLSKSDCFVMPIREGLQIFADPTLHRSRRMGWYGWQQHGFAALDGRRTILLSC
jgi:hypothetical protein